jgi:TPP-dependent indolepyruvate ferredoxin oxidoreductase alpha subunit
VRQFAGSVEKLMVVEENDGFIEQIRRLWGWQICWKPRPLN